MTHDIAALYGTNSSLSVDARLTRKVAGLLFELVITVLLCTMTHDDLNLIAETGHEELSIAVCGDDLSLGYVL